MTDLTVEELDELEQAVRACCSCCRPIDEDKELDIIAMAKRTDAAERERDALREVVRGVASVASGRHLGPWLLGINAERYCGYCGSTYSVHEPTCVWTAMIALAQYASRDTGGAE